MKFIYDPYADAINITFREGKVVKTVEIAQEIILDLDKKGKPLYLEIIGAKEKIGKDSTQEITMKNIIFKKEKVFID